MSARLAFTMTVGPCRRFSSVVPFKTAAMWAADWTADGRPAIAVRLPRRVTRSPAVARLTYSGMYPAALGPVVSQVLRSKGGAR